MRNMSTACIGLAILVVVLFAFSVSAYQGFGAATPGGSGKPLYHVTNLNDSGPGSLREAASQGNRSIVFDVAGTINLSDEITIRSSFLTIDGLTAPSPGITLRNYGLIIRGTSGHDIIIKGIRIRNAALDGIWVTDAAYNVVIDHVSVHGSADGNIDISRAGTRDVTVSWSILAEPAGEEKNSLLAFELSRTTLHHNLFTAAQQRNPQVTYDDTDPLNQDTDTTLDMRNNLIWDWRGGYGTRIRYGARANVVDNFYASNGGDAQDALVICKGLSSDSDCDNDSANVARAYVSGNYSAEGVNLNNRGTETSAFPAATVDTQDPRTAACQVLAGAGVRPLDSTDQQYLSGISLSSCTDSNSPPSADAGPNATALVDEPVVLDGSSSSDPDGDPLTFLWNFGDGATSTATKPTHVYENPGTYTVTLTVDDGSLSDNDTAVVSILLPADADSWRVNAGGAGFTDNSGYAWSADRAYSAGGWGYVGGSTFSTTDSIANTTNDPLYRSERYGNFSYRFDVPDGVYDVILHFAEIYFTGVGQRLFDVRIEGMLALDNYDVYAVSGHDAATSERFAEVEVGDGQLNLDFITVKGNAKVSAIHIQKSTATPSAPNNPPVADAGPDRTGTVGIAVTLDGSGSSDPDDDPLTYMWDFGDGTTASGTIVTRAYTSPGTYTVTLTVSDGVLSDSDTAVVSVTASPSTTYSRLVNAGGGNYLDSAGNTWNADQAYSTGAWGYVGGKTFSTKDPIASTGDDPLYQSERYGNFSYRFDVPNGSYDVTLYFAEIYYTAAGKRLFDVWIEGMLALDNYDVYAASGHDAAMSVFFEDVAVGDGQLNLDFVTVKGNAKVSAIAVRPASP
jgi:PKD repeat protein